MHQQVSPSGWCEKMKHNFAWMPVFLFCSRYAVSKTKLRMSIFFYIICVFSCNLLVRIKNIYYDRLSIGSRDLHKIIALFFKGFIITLLAGVILLPCFNPVLQFI